MKKFKKYVMKASAFLKDKAAEACDNKLALANLMLNLYIINQLIHLRQAVDLIAPQIAVFMLNQLFTIAQMLGDIYAPLERLLQIFSGSGS